jgi:hypothetical protein
MTLQVWGNINSCSAHRNEILQKPTAREQVLTGVLPNLAEGDRLARQDLYCDERLEGRPTINMLAGGCSPASYG